MPPKKGSKPIWIAGPLHIKLEKYLLAGGWGWGKTKYIERLIVDGCRKKPTKKEKSSWTAP